MQNPAPKHFPFTFRVPESPRWLCAVNKQEKAKSIFKKIAKSNKKDFDVDTLELTINQEVMRFTLIKNKICKIIVPFQKYRLIVLDKPQLELKFL